LLLLVLVLVLLMLLVLLVVPKSTMRKPSSKARGNEEEAGRRIQCYSPRPWASPPGLPTRRAMTVTTAAHQASRG
jgi:hypothetical protein